MARTLEPRKVNPGLCMLYGLAIGVLAAVALRLAHVRTAEPSARCRFTWNLWVLGHVSVAVGALAVLLDHGGFALACLLIGVAIQYTVRLNRRRSDRPFTRGAQTR